MIAHLLLTAGLETPEELEAGFLLLAPKYKRQLGSQFPILFK